MSKDLYVRYSMSKFTWRMAEAMGEGVRKVPGCEAISKCVPEALSDDVLETMLSPIRQRGFWDFSSSGGMPTKSGYNLILIITHSDTELRTLCIV